MKAPAASLRRLRANLVADLLAGNLPPTVSALDWRAALASLGPDGLWPDIDYSDRTASLWKLREHLARLLALALHARRADHARSRRAAHLALEAWLARDPINPNWWHNQIGTPRLIGLTLLVLDRPLCPASLRILERAGDFILSHDALHRTPKVWTGANRVWIAANRLLFAALSSEARVAARAFAHAFGEIRLARRGEEGIQRDGAFHQHGPLLYNGGYGAAFVGECRWFLAAARGTPWWPAERRLRVLADLLLDGTRWMTRGLRYDFGCRDREITREEPGRCDRLLPVVELLARSGAPRAAELRAFARGLRAGRAPGALAGFRWYPSSDYAVLVSRAGRVSLRMASPRVVRAECCNDEGRRSHHLADGVTCLQITGEEYEGIFPVWDWRRLPGATLAQGAPPETQATVTARGSARDVAGHGDGRHGLCTQRLATPHLRARQTWFSGPRQTLVALGAGISGAHPFTTLDQSAAQGPVLVNDSARAEPPGHRRLAAVRRLRHGLWCFAFPGPTDLVLEFGPRRGAWSDIGTGSSAPVAREVFLAGIDHGDAPRGASYAYAVAPAPGPAEFEVLSNTPRLQAIWWPREGLLQAAFHAAGQLVYPGGRRTAREPVLLQFRVKS